MIRLPTYLLTMKSMGQINKESLAKYSDIIVTDKPDNADYCVGWGVKPKATRGCALETGFLWDGAHLDVAGLYQNSVINKITGVGSYSITTSDVLKKLEILKSPQSKYGQVAVNTPWEGVVLAAQNPGDRSILSVGTTDDYWAFVERACATYKNNLLIKLHPWNNDGIKARHEVIASNHGATALKCDHSCLSKCRFVLIYNSTFSFDCFVRRVPVAQYAPGYFYKTKAVTFTDRSIPDSVSGTTEEAFKLCDLLVNKYMFHFKMPVEEWVEMFRHFSSSQDDFPMPEHLSYAHKIMSL